MTLAAQIFLNSNVIHKRNYQLKSIIIDTPKPPYYAVIFTSKKIDEDKGYSKMSDRMVKLVSQQNGFLGFESAREELGITVSYWKDEKSILNWKSNLERDYEL